MATMRWGKTLGAYEKWKWIFTRDLPTSVESKSPLSEATYLRDVIAFAHEHNLLGSEWHGKVSVSPQDNGTIVVKYKRGFEELDRYPINTVFDILKKVQDNPEIQYRCKIVDPIEDIRDVLKPFNFAADMLGADLVEIRKEIVNG